MKNPFKNKTPQAATSAPTTRGVQQIQQEYMTYVAELGELEFNYRTIPDRQAEIIGKVKDLAQEMEVLQKAQRAANQEAVEKAKRAQEALKAKEAQVTKKDADAQPG